jgi:hypothetical protein
MHGAILEGKKIRAKCGDAVPSRAGRGVSLLFPSAANVNRIYAFLITGPSTHLSHPQQLLASQTLCLPATPSSANSPFCHLRLV